MADAILTTIRSAASTGDLVAAFHALTAAINAGTITVDKTNVSAAARAARDGAADSGVWGASVAAAFGQSLKAFRGRPRVVALPTESELAASAAFDVLPWDAEEDLSASFSDTSIRTPSPTGSERERESGAIPSSLKRLRHLQLEGGEEAGGAEAGGDEKEDEDEGVNDTVDKPSVQLLLGHPVDHLPPMQVAEKKLIDHAVEIAQRVYDETMAVRYHTKCAPSVDGDDFSGQSGEARMQLRQRTETEAQGIATAVFQAELARGADLQIRLPRHLTKTLVRWFGQAMRRPGDEEGEGDGEEKAEGEGKADGASPAAIPAMLCPPATMLADHDTFVLDCDGVIWHGEDLIPGARQLIDRLRATGKVRACTAVQGPLYWVLVSLGNVKKYDIEAFFSCFYRPGLRLTFHCSTMAPIRFSFALRGSSSSPTTARSGVRGCTRSLPGSGWGARRRIV
jgi:hypothetical protein